MGAAGFRERFCAALADNTIVVYETTSYHRRNDDRALFAFDPALSITWPDGLTEDAVMSEKDRAAPSLSDAERVPVSEWL